MRILSIFIFVGFLSFITADQFDRSREIESLLVCSEEANVQFSRKEYAAALENYQKVINFLRINQLSEPSHLLEAICGSMFCYDMLNQEPFAKAAFDELVNEVSLLNERIEEITWFKNSPIYFQFAQNSNRFPPRILKVDFPSATPEENCQLQCNGYAVAAAYACSRVPSAPIQFLCCGCIFGLEQLCIRCCKGNGFWENCVRGLRRLFYDPEHPQNPAPHPFE